MLPEVEGLRRENAALRLRLAQAEEALRAIRCGEVDALLVHGDDGERLFTLDGADRTYRVLIEEMGEGALTLTSDGVVVYANRRFAELAGRPLAQVIGSRIERCFAAEGYPALAVLRAAGGESKRSAELDLLTGADLRVPTLVSVSRLDVDGLPEALCMVVTDLTGQRRSEAALQARQTLLNVIEQHRRTEERLRMVLAALPAHVALLDEHGVIVSVNDAWKRFARENGYAGQDFGVGQNYLEHCQTASGEAEASTSAAQAIRSVLDGTSEYAAVEYPCHSPSEDRWFRMAVTPLRPAPDNDIAVGAVVMHLNISERKRAEQAVLAEQWLVAQVFEQSNEGLIITDARRRIVKVNRAFTSITGYSEADALGQSPRMLSSGRHDAAFYRSIRDEVEAGEQWQGEVWNHRKDGSDYPLWLSLRRVSNAAGVVTNYIASFSDITLRKESEESIRRLAHFDPLTGLPNRVLLGERATYALQVAQRRGDPLALMFIDLDHFKYINDSLGHRVGDQLLAALATRLQSALRVQDTLSRIGGDEFVLLLPGTGADGAAHVAQKLLQMMQEPSQIERHELTITPSIGIALFPSDGGDFESLAKRADAAMYSAKQGGRNTFRFHTAAIQAHSTRLLQLENGLRRALHRDQLQLHYQPQMSLDGGHIIGVEALLRWQHPELGWVSPAEFIPVAESSGLIASIGEWVLRSAVRQAKAWQDAGMAPIIVAVNLSPVQFRQPELAEIVGRAIEDAGLAPQYLELELTESVASDNPASAVTVMNNLHAIGVRMSIDDFGTGYSSLSYLKRFKVYKLKIDRSFVCNLLEDYDDRAIVIAILGLARSLGLRTIAEGVETEAQAEYLRGKGCDEIQGFWLSRPMPAEQFEAFVVAHAARPRNIMRTVEADRKI